MAKIVVTLPRDSTLLSNILYEGLLFTTQFSQAKFDGISLDLPNDFLIKALKRLDDERIEKIKISMVGKNDNINKKLFKILGVNVTSRGNYNDFIRKMKEYADKLKVSRDIRLGIEFKRDEMVIDVVDEDLTAQLLKVDRYTGVTSLEGRYTSRQITLYASKEAVVLFALGLYSSYITSTGNMFFLLTFSPEEIEDMLNRVDDQEYVKKLFRVKEKVIVFLRDVLSKITINEVILLELYLNAEIRKLIKKEQLEKISVVLFKVAKEGNTYKIYEQVPITIYKELKFYDVIKMYFKNAEDFLENLAEVLKPDGVIFKALENMDKYEEANNIIRAVYGAYRFIVLGHANGWYEFLREIDNAYRKLKGSKKRKEISRAKSYRNILSRFAI